MTQIYYLTRNDLSEIDKDNLHTLPSDFCVITFEEYLSFNNNSDSEDITNYQADQLAIEVRNYLSLIDSINGTYNETLMPHFENLNEYQNKVLEKYPLGYFDSDICYIGGDYPRPLKDIIRDNNSLILMTGHTYEDASQYDYVSLLNNLMG